MSLLCAVGGPEFAQLLVSDIMDVLNHGATRPVARKKAALCLLRLIRKSDSEEDLMPAKEWGPRMAALLEERDLGVSLGLVSLLLGIISRSYEGFEACVPRLVQLLARLQERDVPQDYTYYGIPSPWLQIKILRALQYFPPPEDPKILSQLKKILHSVLSANEPIKNPNKNNAIHGIVFEAAGVAVALEDEELITLVINLLGRYLNVSESNLKYLALENISRLSQSAAVTKAMAKHQKTIISCMSHHDPTIKGSALNLLFTTSNDENAPDIVEELLNAIESADYSMREELVLKAAVLAERFPSSPEWYIDSMVKVMISGGDAITNDIWHAVVHLVSSDGKLHNYAAKQLASLLEDGTANEALVCCGAYILGEYGFTIDVPVEKQFEHLHSYYALVSTETKGVLLNSYEKMRARMEDHDPSAKKIDEVLETASELLDAEVQQRAVEYKLLNKNRNAMKIALQPLPQWEVKGSVLLRKLVGIDSNLDEVPGRPSWLDEDERSTGTNVETEKQEEPVASDDAGHIEETNLVVHGASDLPAVMDLLDFSESDAVAGDMKKDNIDLESETSGPSTANPFTVHTQPDEIVPTEPIGSMEEWFASLCISSSGILYEDMNIQIGVKMASNDADLELSFYLGNKSQEDLQLKKFAIPPSPSFDLDVEEAPDVIPRGRQLVILSRWACIAPYTSFPVLQIKYISSGGHSMARSLDLPISINKFCKAVTIPPSVFVTRWNQVLGAPYKLMEKIPHCIDQGELPNLLQQLHLELLENVDIGHESTCAVCLFNVSGMQSKQVPCMVSVSKKHEHDSAGFTELAVATADPVVTEALKDVLKVQLERIP